MRPTTSTLLALAAVALATNPAAFALDGSAATRRKSPKLEQSTEAEIDRIVAAEAKRARRARKLAAERERIAYADIKRARRMWGAP